MSHAYVNKVVTAVPPHDVHQKFSDLAPRLINTRHGQIIFKRMALRSHIEHRYSYLVPYDETARDSSDVFYRFGHFADTAKRMQFYQEHAFTLAKAALDKLDLSEIRDSITHLIVTSCTGFYAPGLDLQIVEHYGLRSDVERTIIGFMGCYAAFNALKMARHIVRSQPDARVLTLNLELCTIHLQETEDLEELLSFLIFADGCAASLISAKAQGVRLDSFYSTVIPDCKEQITWTIGSTGFDMVLSGKVPFTIAHAVPPQIDRILGGKTVMDMRHWVIHPGGRSILDTIQKSFALSDASMEPSRKVLRDYGNMSSATVMFVMKALLESKNTVGLGCAMAFGPGVTVESMLFTRLEA